MQWGHRDPWFGPEEDLFVLRGWLRLCELVSHGISDKLWRASPSEVLLERLLYPISKVNALKK